MITLAEMKELIATDGGFRIGPLTVHKFNGRYLVTDFDGNEHITRTAVGAAAILNQSVNLRSGKIVESPLVDLYTDVSCLLGGACILLIAFLLLIVGYLL